MSVNFSKSHDRNLKVFRRPQTIVRNCLTTGTRRVSGRDDSGGLVHRAAKGFFGSSLYALTFLERPDDIWIDPPATACVIYVEVQRMIFAVLLHMTDPSKIDGLEYSCTGVMSMPCVPASLTRSSSFVARGAGESTVARAVDGDYAPMRDSGTPVASPYALTQACVRDRNSPPLP